MNPWQNIAGFNKSRLLQLQGRRLSDYIRHYLYPFSPFYRKLLDDAGIDPASITSVADLQRLPLISKTDLVDAQGKPTVEYFVLQPDAAKIKAHWPLAKKLPLVFHALRHGKEGVLDRMEREFRPVFITFTTGTTNKPNPFLYSNYDIDNLRLYGSRMMNVFDVPSTEKIVNMFPYAPHLAFWQVVYGGLAANSLVLSTGGGKVMGTQGNIAILQKMKPALILGVPSYVYHVCREAREKNVDLSFVKKVVLGAAKVPPAFKERLADLLASLGAKDVAVMGTYGFTEARCAWGECPTALDVSSGYHLYPDKEIIEIIDPETGEIKGEGEDGEIVYTSIDSRGSAVMRYRTGDFAIGGVTYEPCPHCGRTTPRLSSDITRLSNVKDLQLSKIKGSLVNLNHFSSCMDDVPDLEEWQIVLQKKNNDPFDVDQLIVYASPANSADKGALEKRIRESVLQTTEVSPNAIHFIALAELVERLELETANKEKRILDLRPKD